MVVVFDIDVVIEGWMAMEMTLMAQVVEMVVMRMEVMDV